MWRSLASPVSAFVVLIGLFSSGIVSPASRQGATARLSGVVLDGVTERPLSSVLVRVGRYSGRSDGEGRFAIELAPGRYSLEAVRAGYTRLGSSEWGVSGTDRVVIDVSAGEDIEGSIRLDPAGAVSGRILDTSGRGVRDAVVVPYRYVYDDAGRYVLRPLAGWRPATGATFPRIQLGIPFPGQTVHVQARATDDRGEFRVYNLEPGRYAFYVAPETDGRGLVGAFAGGGAAAASAVVVEVGAGEEFRLDDVVLDRGRSGTLELRVLPPWGSEAFTYTFVAIHPAGSEVAPHDEPLSLGPGENLGPFDPGVYDVEIGTGTTDPELRIAATRVQIRMDNEDMAVDVPVPSGASLSGKVMVEDADGVSAPVSGIDVALRSRDLFGDLTWIRTSDPNGEFRFAELPEGIYDVVSVSGERCAVGMSQGNRDALRAGVDVHKESPELLVTLTEAPNEMFGIVRTADGDPVPGGVVTLVPDRREEIHRFAHATSDQNGRFEISCIPAGSYRLYAWTSIESNAYRNSEFMGPYAGGQAVVIGPRDVREFDVTVIR